MPVKLHDHQEDAVNRMHNGCVLYGGTGVGKTITSLAYYFTKVCGGELNKWGSMKTPKHIFIMTTATVRDKKSFELQAALMHIHADPAISTNNVKITVDSWNNVAKYKEIKDAFFIFDEQRVVGYGAWSKAFIKIAKHNEWILLSATPGDTWMDYIPVFIANGFYRNKSDFVDQHVIWTPRVKYPKVLRYQNVGTLVRRRNDVLVHMPYTRTTTRHAIDIECGYDEAAFRKVTDKRWHVYEQRPLRDVAELFGVMRKVVNSDASRLEAVGSLLEKHPRLVVFYNFDYELEMLRTLGTPAAAISAGPSPASSARTTSTAPGTASTPRQRTPNKTSSPSPSEGGPTPSGLPSSSTAISSRQTTSTSTSSPTRESPGTRSSKTSASPHPTSSTTTTPHPGQTPATPSSPTSGTTSKRSTSGSSASTNSDSCSDATRSQRLSGTPETSPRPSTTSSKCELDGPTAQQPSTSGSQPSKPSSSGSETSSEACSETPCIGHWTADEGSGEVFYNCNDWDWLTSDLGKSANAACKPVPELVVAEWNGHKHEPIPDSARWVYLVQYRAGAEGWNCIETDAMVFFSQTYSYRDWFQAHGRIDRLNTPFKDLYYYHLISRSVIDKAIRKALRSKKSFNERNLDVSRLKTVS